MIEVRRADLPQDQAGIAALDTAVATTSILAATVEADGVRLTSVPRVLTKRFPLEDLDAAERPWDRAWVATGAGRIVGFAATGFQNWNRRLVLWHFYVDGPARGQGIGRDLMEAVREEARRLGARHIWLETSNQNPSGVAVYQALGFSLTGLDLTLYDATPSEGEFALFLSRTV